MAVPDIVRNVTKNVREALSSREEFKEKAKDLPLYVLQTALSGVGQALLLGDRVRTTIKRLTGQTEEAEETDEASQKPADQRAEAAEPVEGTERKAEEKPARREPVIFAPRPETTASKDGEDVKAEANGTKKRPEPVIFAPAASKASTPETATTQPEPVAESRPEPVTGSKTAEPEVEPAVTAPKAGVETGTETAGLGIAEPPAAKIEVTEVEVTKPKTADAAAAEVTETRVAEPVAKVTEAVVPAGTAEVAEVAEVTVPAEPMPGHSGLTIASLRARMRGKTAEQIRELLAYERATTARADVVRMYENRLAKIEAAE
ncbi:hypothetical protein [Streptosporangium sp. NPDC006007]|uniref:hypothetical protein n=1 Tax=Streptosporangium sp. NPDC006007 TaxID=3154575 RepID=UPI0033A3C27F